jgi:drug/metabolite transporter (DMT)-like permease
MSREPSRTPGPRTKHLVLGVVCAVATVAAMFPPIYLAVSGRQSVLGMPRSMAYFLLVGLFVTGTVVVLYLLEERKGEVE